MTSEQDPNKRRRTDAAATLSRPFKSPLRRPEPTEDASTPDANDSPAGNTADAITELIAEAIANPTGRTEPTEPTVSHDPATTADDTDATDDTVLPHKPACGARLLPAANIRAADPELTKLRLQESALRGKLDTLRMKLTCCQQAHSIEASDKIAEMEALIVKWRRVRQKAAEEVFEGARQRVIQRGGFKAFKERSVVAATAERMRSHGVDEERIEELAIQAAAEQSAQDDNDASDPESFSSVVHV